MNLRLKVGNTSFPIYGRALYLHNGIGKDVTAYEINETCFIRVLLPRTLGVVSVYTQVYNESLGILVTQSVAEWADIIDGMDAFDSKIDFNETGVGLYFFRFIIELQDAVLYGYREGDRLVLSDRFDNAQMYQLSVCDFKHRAPKNKYGGIIYHIFVDRFNRGGEVDIKPGAVLVSDWSVSVPEYPEYPGAPLKNNTFFGGTLWGIIDKLDYIRSLGVDTIYLSPIFDAASNHKYDTGDYLTVDSMFGGEKALRQLIKKAKEYGIGIILDGVFNHTGSDSIYFNRYGNYDSIGAYQSKSSEYYPWFEFKSYPDKYTCWWDIDILPRINPDNPECRAYFVADGGVISKYASLGIDGFRLDVVDELSDEFVEEIKNTLSVSNKESILYGEVWEDASNKIAYGNRKRYYLGSELDGVMNYPVRTGIINYLRRHNCDALKYALTDVLNNAPVRIRNLQMNLLGTHDTERIITVLGAESGEGRSNTYLATKRMNDIERGIAKRKLRMAYTILATIPGIPSIFYGDETALEGYRDPFNRMPYPWDRQDMKLIDFYRKIGRLRRENSVYATGDFSLNYLDNDLLIFTRSDEKTSLVTCVNNSKLPITVSFNDDVVANIEEKSGNIFTLPAFSAEIFAMNSGNCIFIE